MLIYLTTEIAQCAQPQAQPQPKTKKKQKNTTTKTKLDRTMPNNPMASNYKPGAKRMMRMVMAPQTVSIAGMLDRFSALAHVDSPDPNALPAHLVS